MTDLQCKFWGQTPAKPNTKSSESKPHAIEFRLSVPSLRDDVVSALLGLRLLPGEADLAGDPGALVLELGLLVNGKREDRPGLLGVLCDELQLVLGERLSGGDVRKPDEVQDLARFLVGVELNLESVVDVAEALDPAVRAGRD